MVKRMSEKRLMLPSISILITTYNWKEALALVLQSVSQQSHLPKEVLIADDGSRDDTAKLIQHYQKTFPVPLIHCWQEDLGFRAAAVRNKAIAASTSDYIVMIDGDMVLHSNFIADHLHSAQPNQFIQGSRVITFPDRVKKMLNGNMSITFYSSGINNRTNTLNLPLLSRYFSHINNELQGTKTCNFSAWRNDLVAINGFNEDYVGWGREDSDLAARLFHSGKKRLKLKFMANAYHLYHPENARKSLQSNDERLAHCIESRQIRCDNGLDGH